MKEEDLNLKHLTEKIKSCCGSVPRSINEFDVLLVLKGMTNANPKHPFVRKLYIESLKWLDENNLIDEDFSLRDSLNFIDYNTSIIERFIKRMAIENNEKTVHNSMSLFDIFYKA